MNQEAETLSRRKTFALLDASIRTLVACAELLAILEEDGATAWGLDVPSRMRRVVIERARRHRAFIASVRLEQQRINPDLEDDQVVDQDQVAPPGPRASRA